MGAIPSTALLGPPLYATARFLDRARLRGQRLDTWIARLYEASGYQTTQQDHDAVF